MKKLLTSLVCCLVMLFGISIMPGCGSSKGTLYILNFKPEFADYYNEINAAFEEKENIKIEYVATDTANYANVLNSRFQSGFIDVFFSQTNYMINGQSDYMLDLSGISGVDKYEDGVIDFGKYKETLYTMPIAKNANLVFYNKKIFSEYSLNVPKTYADFVALCDTLNDISKNPQINKTKVAAPMFLAAKTEWTVNMFTGQIAADYIFSKQPDFYTKLKQNDASAKVNNGNWQEAYKRVKGLSGYLNSTFSGSDYATAARYFAKGNNNSYFAMLPDGSWNYSQIMKASPDFEVGMFSLPGGDTEQESRFVPTKVGYTVSVYRNSKNAEMSKKYIEFLFEESNYKKFIDDTFNVSLLKGIKCSNDFINSVFEIEGAEYVSFDNNSVRYLPLEPSPSDVIEMLKGEMEVITVLNNWNEKVEQSYKDWSQHV